LQMTSHMITFVSDLRQVGGFLRVFRFLPPINIVESGIKHHKSVNFLLK
jgi:hypothetical protein